MCEIEEKLDIKNMIYEIRGKQVMLDSDLAKLYGCANGTKSINLAVSRNIECFPNDFYFQLSKTEYENLKFQNETSSNNHGGVRKMPYAFTEQGVAMLSSVLKTEKANKVSVNIMRAFVEMRKFIQNNSDIFNRLTKVEYKLLENDEKFEILFNELQGKEQFKEKLFYDGQIYDAYSLLINIIREAKEKIIIIDNYIDKTIFDILSYKDEDIEVEIWTKNVKSKLDYDKFNLQYPNVEIIKKDNFHDRFIIIDDSVLYHVGASLKDLGKKCFAISKMDKENIPKLIK